MRLSDQEIDTLCKTVETTQRGQVALVFARAIEAAARREALQEAAMAARAVAQKQGTLGRQFACVDAESAIRALIQKEPPHA